MPELRLRRSYSLVTLLLGAIFVLAGRASGETMQTVPHVDLNRYQGRWYEIVRLPLRWENKCASDVTANYTLRPDGKIGVLNQCRKKDGSLSESKGTARPASKQEPNSKLKVTFFWPFSGDYWILALDPEYQWALVGTPNRKNLWVLSRQPHMEKAALDRLLEHARSLGFDITKLIYTKQN
ncbi:lipocalin family protein [Edaphobacter sp. 12200R-103]|jgi:apolipoprotein D and lipocalin family protein|uniref:lipocalin family protein n=1 Tax=Edaphobacter sp. 12200R-103 TaxID=2703788 RepID=UPI00138BE11C|nr:lipocalin family protein [Edaphobacter sp. 12200R-103]QHS52662.1 lipocalin family protein [Edaphobacter sp. 12200R-103]